MVKEGKDQYIRWLRELNKDDVVLAGGKGANLGEMYNSGIPVPPAFVVTTTAYSEFLDKTKLKEKIKEKLAGLDEENTEELEQTAKEIRHLIDSQEMPKKVEEEIEEAYENISIDKDALKGASEDAKAILSRGFELAFVAVRSSATAEDSVETSFAGQNKTFLNIKGKRDLLRAVKECWASLFTARSVYYQIKNKLINKDILIAVIVQQMINSDKSGVIFSRDPIKENENIVIEAVLGLGEGIVSGKIKPDNYVVNRNMEILEKNMADKKIALIRNSSGETEQVPLTPERSKSQVLSDYETRKLADYAVQLEEHYKHPQDIEFAIDSGIIYIVQTRPVTTLGKKKVEISRGEKGEVILTGLAASPGAASGVVKIIDKLEDLSKIQKGDILVTKMTNPDMVVTMQKSAAIVTDEGGLTAHAAIVSREMGIPAVVGTQEATEKLRDGQLVSVDGSAGKVYAGEGAVEEKQVEIKPVIESETKIKVMVDLPSFAERAAETKIKEVGLTRIEGIISETGKHPYLFEKEKRLKDYEEIVYSGVSRISKFFDKLWVRTSDIRSDEFMNLQGAPKEKEPNPMLGLHGIRDSLLHPEILKAELNALKKVADEGKKIGILLPQLISVDEIQKVKKILDEISFNVVEVGVMVETPAAVEIIEDICQEGIDFISFGTNDLTQYTLAVDRGNEDVQYIYDEMNPAVLNQLKHVIEICKIYDVETSICGQAGSKKEMTEFLVKHGIDSISVNADKAEEISKFVAELEKKGLRGSELEKDIEEEKELIEKEEQVVGQEKEEKQEVEKEKHVEPSYESQEKTDDSEIIELGQEQKKQEQQADKIQKELKEKREEEEKQAEETMKELKEEREGQVEEAGEKAEEFPEFESNIDVFEPAEETKETVEPSIERKEDKKLTKPEQVEEKIEEEFEVGESKKEDEEEQGFFGDKKAEVVLEPPIPLEPIEQIPEPIKNERGKYDIICSLCGKKAEVPFKPDRGRPVYCKACYKLGEKGRKKLRQEKQVKPSEENKEKKQEQHKNATPERNSDTIEEHFYVDEDELIKEDPRMDIY